MPVLFLEVQGKKKKSSFKSTFFFFMFFFYFFSKKNVSQIKKKLILSVASSWNLILLQNLYFLTFIQILEEKKNKTK